jgi:peptidoglycan hydrolase CwlO-like protein
MQNLSETDKVELAKTIRAFLESKGIKLPTAEEMQAKKGEIQQQKQEAKGEIKKARQEIQSARQDIKQARQNLRERKPLPPKNGTASGTVAQ